MMAASGSLLNVIQFQRILLFLVRMVLFANVAILSQRFDFFNHTDQLAFKMWLHAEICEAGQHDAWFVFSLSHVASDLKEVTVPSGESYFKSYSDYYGSTCVPEAELMPVMMGSPFYESFSGLPPFSDDNSSPPSSHRYDSDASFDSIAEFNIEIVWKHDGPSFVLCFNKVCNSCLSDRQWCSDGTWAP
jgi:hypothetical protein